MNKQEAAKLLSLIKLSYPTAYRDIDRETANATVNMWASSFPEVPYPIMEQAFNHFRMVSKFPPTVAEIVEELKQLHYQATELALINNSIGNEDGARQYRAVMACTSRYKDMDNFWGQLKGAVSGMMIDGGGERERFATPGDRVDGEDRLPFLDAGEGRP